MLSLNKLTKKYGSFTALNGLSLEIADGQLHGAVAHDVEDGEGTDVVEDESLLHQVAAVELLGDGDA